MAKVLASSHARWTLLWVPALAIGLVCSFAPLSVHWGHLAPWCAAAAWRVLFAAVPAFAFVSWQMRYLRSRGPRPPTSPASNGTSNTIPQGSTAGGTTPSCPCALMSPSCPDGISIAPPTPNQHEEVNERQKARDLLKEYGINRLLLDRRYNEVSLGIFAFAALALAVLSCSNGWGVTVVAAAVGLCAAWFGYGQFIDIRNENSIDKFYERLRLTNEQVAKNHSVRAFAGPWYCEYLLNNQGRGGAGLRAR